MPVIPKYQIVVNWIKDKIYNSELGPGDKLESENELSQRFGISRQTVRHAISILEQEGLIESRQGSGSYVSNFLMNQKKGSRNIVIVSTYLGEYIFPNIIEGMERVLSEEGYGIQISFTHNKVENERKVLRRILDEMDVDGVIVEPTKSGLPNPNLEIYDEIVKKKIPVLFFNSYYPGLDLPHVCLDDRQAGYMATNYLLELGHRKIAGIFKSDDGQGRLRYQGYLDALMEKGIHLKDEHIIWIDTEDEKTLVKDDKRVLRRLKGCTACVPYNDTIAYSVETICLRNNIRIPEDLSIASIDNSELAKLCEVPVTSVVHPMGALGERAAKHMLELIKDNSFDATYEYEPEICIRDSCRRLE